MIVKYLPNTLIGFLLAASSDSSSATCIPPINITDVSGFNATIPEALFLNPQFPPILPLPLGLRFAQEFITKLETPLQFRTQHMLASTVYNAAAKFHETALDIWGRDEYRLCLPNPTNAEEEANFRLHEYITMAYTFYSASKTILPHAKAILDIEMVQIGLDTTLLETPVDHATPWGIARYAAENFATSVVNDGWNADGKLSGEYNVLPFQDFSLVGDNGVAYQQYEVSTERATKKWPWKPLMDTDGFGGFSKQEYVTPFAGFTGRLYGMDRTYYDGFTSPPPSYGWYKAEARDVLKTTNTMATNITQKLLVEAFNSKVNSLLQLEIQWNLADWTTNFDFWWKDMIVQAAMYDATLLVWKEKIRHNAVRPTTVVHELLGSEIIETYAGPTQGSKPIPANEWQPYVRTMPMAEYPSASACICTSFAEMMVKISGSDDIIPAAAGTLTFPAQSLKTEPSLPSSDISVAYRKWSEVRDDCGESRLHGGMHFKGSVPAGYDLCKGFADPVYDHAILLRDGDPSGRLAEYEEDITISTLKGKNRNIFKPKPPGGVRGPGKKKSKQDKKKSGQDKKKSGQDKKNSGQGKKKKKSKKKKGK